VHYIKLIKFKRIISYALKRKYINIYLENGMPTHQIIIWLTLKQNVKYFYTLSIPDK